MAAIVVISTYLIPGLRKSCKSSNYCFTFTLPIVCAFPLGYLSYADKVGLEPTFVCK